LEGSGDLEGFEGLRVSTDWGLEGLEGGRGRGSGHKQNADTSKESGVIGGERTSSLGLVKFQPPKSVMYLEY
jgi:hypothetical protein